MIINERDRVQIDSVKYKIHYRGESPTMRDVLDYIASLQRQIDRLNIRLSQIEARLTEDDAK